MSDAEAARFEPWLKSRAPEVLHTLKGIAPAAPVTPALLEGAAFVFPGKVEHHRARTLLREFEDREGRPRDGGEPWLISGL